MSPKSFLVSALVALSASLVGCKPTNPSFEPHLGELRPARHVDIREAVNRTVCPIRIEINEDPNRIPRRIKFIRCAAHPMRVCRERQIPDVECCGHTHNHQNMECVELYDKVVVKFAHGTSDMDVPVGCSCMITPSSEASTVPPP